MTNSHHGRNPAPNNSPERQENANEQDLRRGRVLIGPNRNEEMEIEQPAPER